MQTTEGDTCQFLHNGNFDGDVIIQEKAFGGTFVTVPFDDLRTLIAAWARHNRIAIIENATEEIESLADDLLG